MRRDYGMHVDYDSEHTLREMHQLLKTIHSHALAMSDACQRFRFDVVDADKYFNRITQGGMLTNLEKMIRGVRNYSDECHVTVRCELDCIDWPVHPHDREDGPWKRCEAQILAQHEIYRKCGLGPDGKPEEAEREGKEQA